MNLTNSTILADNFIRWIEQQKKDNLPYTVDYLEIFKAGQRNPALKTICDAVTVEELFIASKQVHDILSFRENEKIA